jgi:arylsulfate sulfotransferase
MNIPKPALGSFAAMAALCVPAFATVQITALTPSVASPQVIGTSIIWTAKATDSSAGPLTFQFNVAPPGGSLALVKDFNVGTSKRGSWISLPFAWVPTGIDGSYQIQVVIKDFTTGQSTSKTVKYTINPLVTGSMPVAVKTANPLVALFSAPSCPAGSTMQVSFQQQSMATPATTTNSVKCHPPKTMTFEIAGMYPSTTYNMFSQTNTGGTITNGPTVSFTTGALPTNVPFPKYAVNIPAGPSTDTTDSMLLIDPIQFGAGPIYPVLASDLNGKVIWYYSTPASAVVTRPLSGGTILTIQSSPAWNSSVSQEQYLRLIDVAGNIVKETNIGVIQQELVALGATDGGPCTAISKPPPVGSACLDTFHHDAILLPNGDTAAFVNIEKIFPPGTQGDTSGLPVDIVGDMILVLNSNWQVIWYFDAFQHDSGAPQLDITRAAVLGETCTANAGGCPPMELLGSGIAPSGKDWLHGNSLYFWPQTNDIIWSSRNQDWVMKLDYNNGAGTGNILWRMGPCGDFSFDNIYNDPWPWFSAQHEVGIENNGSGPMTMFDNGDTRVSPPSGPGSSSGCMPGVGSGNSRGMALTFTESNMQVMPVLSADLGVYSTADGSAQLLPNGNYFFVPAVVLVSLTTEDGYFIEILPTAGTDTGVQVLNLQSTDVYRGWQMPSFYNPPIT